MTSENVEKMKITPERARQFLETVPEHQRRVRQRQVEKIARDITNGNWRENGATIVFDTKGNMSDGQHRCHAIIAANRPVWSLVVRGVSSSIETFHTIDSVAPRQTSDFIHTPSATATAAVARVFWVQQNGGLDKELSGGRLQAQIADVLKTAGPYLEQMSQCYHEITNARKQIGLGSFCAFLLFYYRHIAPVKNQERLTEFWQRIGDGIGLAEGDPALTIRNRRGALEGNARRKDITSMAIIIKCLHAYLDHKQMRLLTFREGEEFPKLRGNIHHAKSQ